MCMEGGGWSGDLRGQGHFGKYPNSGSVTGRWGPLAQSSHGASPLAIGPI